jgi:hypothetical protein
LDKEDRGIARRIKNLQITLQENSEVAELKENISLLESELTKVKKDIVYIKKVVSELKVKE